MSHEIKLVFPALALSCLGLCPTAGAALEDPTYSQLRAARPDGRRIEVEDLVLERDVFRFELRSGAFHLFSPVGGETVSAVFLGDGGFRLSPATENERRHLGMIRAEEGFEVLADDFDELVLHFTDCTFDELARAAEIVEGDPDPHLRAVVGATETRR